MSEPRGCPGPQRRLPKGKSSAAGRGGDAGQESLGSQPWLHIRISRLHQNQDILKHPRWIQHGAEAENHCSREWDGRVSPRGSGLGLLSVGGLARGQDTLPASTAGLVSSSQPHLTLVKNWQAGTKGPAWNSKAVTHSPPPPTWEPGVLHHVQGPESLRMSPLMATEKQAPSRREEAVSTAPLPRPLSQQPHKQDQAILGEDQMWGSVPPVTFDSVLQAISVRTQAGVTPRHQALWA